MCIATCEIPAREDSSALCGVPADCPGKGLKLDVRKIVAGPLTVLPTRLVIRTLLSPWEPAADCIAEARRVVRVLEPGQENVCAPSPMWGRVIVVSWKSYKPRCHGLLGVLSGSLSLRLAVCS